MSQDELNARRIARVRTMNPVNAGLSTAAHELDSATYAYRQAEGRYFQALHDFNAAYRREVPS